MCYPVFLSTAVLDSNLAIDPKDGLYLAAGLHTDNGPILPAWFLTEISIEYEFPILYVWNIQQDRDLDDLGVCGLSFNTGFEDEAEVGVLGTFERLGLAFISEVL